MSYKPPYTINSKMLDYVSKIMKNMGQISEKNRLDNKPKLRKTNKINSIYSSLAIENNSLSKEQVKDIINGKLVIGPAREILEVKNAIKCYDDILNIDPFKVAELLKYHGIMMKGLIDDAGMFRNQSEGVYDGDNVIFIAPPKDRVPHLIDQLFDYLNNYEENILIKSCVFHYEFEFIHPFSDGNGRMGRLFQTCLLKTEEKLFAFLPIESIIKERQQEYYNAISTCNTNGNCDVFIEFMLDAIYETLERTKKNNYNEDYSIQVKKILNIMKDGVSYTTKELLNLLKMKSRSSFKKNYLDPAMELGLIKMTIPDSPRSKNQKYTKA
ncbi:MAG: Fic family protein [Bacilli bacterium]|nr:Fic family protein [Bacilli bacterium]MDD4298541.1 Fic family protein [Bacilli bacterium]